MEILQRFIVLCIANEKAHKQYEFGAKLVVSTSQDNFVIVEHCPEILTMGTHRDNTLVRKNGLHKLSKMSFMLIEVIVGTVVLDCRN